MRLLSSSRARWYLLAALWAALLILGLGGFMEQEREAGLDRSTLDTLYLTVQLATLDYGGGDDALNWRLEVARFVAPMMAATTLLQTASVVFRDQFARLRLRFLHDHVIVCGLGGAGSRLAIALARAGHHVVGVEKAATSPGIAALRSHDVPVVVGDATDPDLLRATRIQRASRVVAVCGADANNVAVAATVREVGAQRSARTSLRCSVHLEDTELCMLLRAGELASAGDVRIEFFNFHERAARSWLAEHPPFGDGTTPPHLVVIGLGQLGRSLVVAAAQRWADGHEGRVRITLVDRAATGRWHALRLQHPALPGVVDAVCLDVDLDQPTGDVVDEFTACLRSAAPTAVAIAFEDESLALSTALLVHRVVQDPDVEIVVRTNADTGLGSLVAPPGQPDQMPFPGLSVFPFLDRACTPAVVEGGVREQLARAIHEDHLSRTGVGSGLRQVWEDLDDEERESSRRAADGIVQAMADLGFDLVPLRHWGDDGARLLTADLKKLARWEHERWCEERKEAGWIWGPERDDEQRRNPLLLPWEELAAEAKASNVAAARALPRMLARAGFEPLARRPSD